MNSTIEASKRRDARAVKGMSSPLDGWACSHPYFDLVLSWLLRRIQQFSEPAVFLIVGPTGVGKSTVIRQLRRELAKWLAAELVEHPLLLPSVYAEGLFTPGQGFDWETLFTDLLEDAQEILVDRKMEKAWPKDKTSLRGLMRAANNMLLLHAPAVVIVDEGGSLLEGGSQSWVGRSSSAKSTDAALRKNLSYLKSLGNRSRTHFAIFGDYSLARMVAMNGQLNRRCHLIHFAAYASAQQTLFNPVVSAFESRLRSAGMECDLASARDLLFHHSIGCVGLLRRWMVEAYTEAKHRGVGLTPDLIKSLAPPAGSVERWSTEIQQGIEEVRRFVGSDATTGVCCST